MVTAARRQSDAARYPFHDEVVLVGGDKALLLRPRPAPGAWCPEQEEAHLVNTGSVAGLLTGERLPIYTATKHGVVALSEALHRARRISRIVLLRA